MSQKFVNPFGAKYPDDNAEKEVLLQAYGLDKAGEGADRHVLIYWINGENEDTLFMQLVQLSGGIGNYNFYTPCVQAQSKEFHRCNASYPLGMLTRAQRDQIIELAKGTGYERTSTLNSCRTWTRDLLEKMVEVGMISESQFERIDKDVPLKRRVPEA